MPQMSPAEEAAWRARRTGRQLDPTTFQDQHRSPEATPFDGRSPIAGLPGAGDLDPEFTPAPAPAPAAAPTGPTLEEMQAQLAALSGRVAPVQQQNEQLRAAAEAANASLAAAQARLAEVEARMREESRKAQIASFNPFDGMPPELLENMDPSFRQALDHVGRRATQHVLEISTANTVDPAKLVADALAAKEQRELSAYLGRASEELNLMALGNDAKFNAFVRDDDSAALVLSAFVNANSIETARTMKARVAKLIGRYESTTKAAPQQHADAPSGGAAHLRRSPSAAASAGGGQAKAATQEEVRALSQQAKTLSRQGRHKEAREILARIQ